MLSRTDILFGGSNDSINVTKVRRRPEICILIDYQTFLDISVKEEFYNKDKWPLLAVLVGPFLFLLHFG